MVGKMGEVGLFGVVFKGRLSRPTVVSIGKYGIFALERGVCVGSF